MNDILELEIPKELYINNTVLKSMVTWGEENFSYPEEVLSYFNMSPRYWKYWVWLSKSGDKKAIYIVDEFENMVNRWVNKTRHKVLRSNDLRSISTLFIPIQEKQDRKQDNEVELPVQDNWVD